VAQGRQPSGWPWFVLVVVLLSWSGVVDRVEPAFMRWVPGACGAILFWMVFFAPRLRRREKADRVRRVSITDTKIELETDAGVMWMDWSRVTRIHKEASFVLLVAESGTFVPIPKAWAKDDAEWQQLLAVLPRRETA
jgi:hypothetical protein